MPTLRKITVQFRESDTHTSQTLTLDGVTFRLDAYTNRDSGTWFADFFDANGVALVRGIALVCGVNLLYQYQYKPGVPPGNLFVQDQSGLGVDPGLGSFFSGDAALYYLDSQ